ncbi:DNA/RNA non-specific endonuclease [Rhizobium oryzicola]|uniref:Serine protease n=1 Tax=Rhizobium oryzicola TaxID=1232668 RepID=A0ABT8T053_9HYPH|nr:DNA/RNA non-specific endonuclease [Rhizobium oryzicola]MDO1583611.1 DNA/RNA non-specific endonuclease [Rhizobium oryzicola]
MKLEHVKIVEMPAAEQSLLAGVPAGSTVEYIAKRPKFLTADGQTATPLEQEALFERNDLLEVNFLDRCILVRRCVGRIEIKSASVQGWATGFLIAPGMVLTNNHVFSDAAAVGTSRIVFDYWFDVAGQRPQSTDFFEFQPELFFVTSKTLDYTVVAVSPTSLAGNQISDRSFLRLIPESGKIQEEEFVTIFQHPEGNPMQVALRENEVTRARQDEDFIWYRADTAHGSSGGCVTNNSLQVVALHSGGCLKRNGEGKIMLVNGGLADSTDGLLETDVQWEANRGYRASRIAADLVEQTRRLWPQRLADIERALRTGDVMSTAIQPTNLRPQGAIGRADASKEQEIQMVQGSGSTDGQTLSVSGQQSLGSVVLPLQLRVSLEVAGTSAPVLATAGSTGLASTQLETEAYKMRTPIIYDGLSSRAGFNSRFLDPARDVPRPVITEEGKAILAPLLEGSEVELKYAHFSVWMHKERRLALFTATNVDWRDRRKVVDGKSTSRASLAGWSDKASFAERWALDPRMDPRYQLPDEFYNNDRGAFDKGHISRRDDVCWGATFAEIQMANGDTFHVTNCSPQRKEFNQGAMGQENWGDLETAIQTITKKELQPACIFAGPMLRANDGWFEGEDTSGAARIRIPSEFWKIVVVKGVNDFEVYSFLLKQEVRDVTENEFYVTDEWLAAYKPVSVIQEGMRGWLDLSELARYDQHGKATA